MASDDAPAVRMSADCPHDIDWAATSTPAKLTEDERDRLLYRFAAEVAQRLEGMAGWRIQRAGVGVHVWIGPDRFVCRAPDYTVFAEDQIGQHLHRLAQVEPHRMGV